ncbi:hypothetical protein N5E15_22000 [Pantoea stewartii]|uniref:hypothetical protein n=1 Tax=Pantoea stewartii TaxID=66269 RepID=UPI0021D4B30B|nr:hypothetical protein [Pantoea stewartii]MCU7369252.1 hypothetical protein [Pantoea stewartii]
MFGNQDHTHSMQSIRTNTDVIDSFPTRIHNHEDAVQVRRMRCRKSANRQHFIVTLKSDVDRAEKSSRSSSTVKPLTEVVIKNSKTFFIFDLSEQYPDLERYEHDISVQIERSVESFMAKFCKMNEQNCLSVESVRKWHHL